MRLFFILLLVTTSTCLSQNSILEIESLVFNGQFTDAKLRIKRVLQNKSISQKSKSKYYQLNGDIFKLEGDIDEALRNWQKSNQLRLKIYKKGDYHLAWNYALLSNYYYEKIEPKLAVKFADSCSILISKLDLEKQKEIQIFKIWNILAQSYKMGLGELDTETRLKQYNDIREYYRKSLKFITKEKLPLYYKAKTFHLIANTYHDNLHDLRCQSGNTLNAKNAFEKALQNYSFALSLWEKEYGRLHFERAKTLYVKGIMYTIIPDGMISKPKEIAESNFRESLNALNINPGNNVRNWKIPNRHDALQCLKYYKILLTNKLNKKSGISEIEKLDELNDISVEIWLSMYRSFKTKNMNMYLSIYNLVPFQDIIEVEKRKKLIGLKWSNDAIFKANQMLKYYDLNRFMSSKELRSSISISDFQKHLQHDQLFIDFIDDATFIVVTKEESKLIVLSEQLHIEINKLNSTIMSRDFDSFVSISFKVFDILFSGINHMRFERIDVSPSSNVNQLPFEALLISKTNAGSRKFSELDYLIKHKSIQYHLSAQQFLKRNSEIEYSGICFAPAHPSLTELPFSRQLANKLEKNHGFSIIEAGSQERTHFLSTNQSILHFSGHGLIDHQNPGLSTLQLTSSQVSLNEIYEIKKCPSLVVLNACNSFSGKTNLGDGVNGFARAFHAVGANATISNIWEVDDQASNQLFETFYSSLSKGGSTNTALRRAQLNLIAGKDGFDAPYYWAGHRMFGDVKILPQTKTPKTTFVWILGVLGLVVIFIILIRYCQ